MWDRLWYKACVTSKRYPRLDVRATESQIDRWRRLAEMRGLTLPKLVRALLDGAAEKAGVS